MLSKNPATRLPPMKNALGFIGMGVGGLAFVLLLVTFADLQFGDAEWVFAGGVLTQVVGYGTQCAQQYLSGRNVQLPTMSNVFVCSGLSLFVLMGVLSLQAFFGVRFDGPAWGLIGSINAAIQGVGSTAIQFYTQGPAAPKE